MFYKAREKVINFLMIILQLYLRLNMGQFMEKGSLTIKGLLTTKHMITNSSCTSKSR